MQGKSYLIAYIAEHILNEQNWSTIYSSSIYFKSSTKWVYFFLLHMNLLLYHIISVSNCASVIQIFAYYELFTLGDYVSVAIFDDPLSQLPHYKKRTIVFTKFTNCQYGESWISDFYSVTILKPWSSILYVPRIKWIIWILFTGYLTGFQRLNKK